MDDVIVTQLKVLGLQVCSAIHDPETLTAKTNILEPCGTTAGWVLSDRPECAPVPCESYPERTHYVFDC